MYQGRDVRSGWYLDIQYSPVAMSQSERQCGACEVYTHRKGCGQVTASTVSDSDPRGLLLEYMPENRKGTVAELLVSGLTRGKLVELDSNKFSFARIMREVVCASCVHCLPETSFATAGVLEAESANHAARAARITNTWSIGI